MTNATMNAVRPTCTVSTLHGMTLVNQDNFDTLTINPLGEALMLAQTDEDGELHDVILGREQAQALFEMLKEYLR